MESVKTNNWEPKILAFLCNWCSYAGADLAGTSRIQYPSNIRVIRVPCSGRVNPLFIVKALQAGVDGVLVSGCHPGDCHYLTGNYVGRRKSATLKQFLEYLGVEEGRPCNDIYFTRKPRPVDVELHSSSPAFWPVPIS